MRIYSPISGPLFWDPGGTYATHGFTESRRERDLIVEPIPTLGEYLAWRHHLPTRKIEIFEFELSEARARELWQSLRSGSDTERPGARFETKSVGGFCSLAVSRFLARFAADVTPIEASLLPHNMARQFYESGTEQVYVYSRNELFRFAPTHAEPDESP